MLGWYITIRRLWLACGQTDSKKSIWEKGDFSEQQGPGNVLKSQSELGRWGNE